MGSLDLVISSCNNGVKIASLSDGEIVDYLVENKDNDFYVGDIILGMVKKKATGINSFFVTFNLPVDGFMHFSDLFDKTLTLNSFCSDLLSGKKVKVTTYPTDKREERAVFDYNYTAECINDGDIVLAQVVKEPLFNKGPRLSGRITLAGDFVILVIFSNDVKLSKKIGNDQAREAMMNILTELKNDLKLNNFGLVLRTSAELFIDFKNHNEAKKLLLEDILALLKVWSDCIEKIKNAKVGTKIYSANDIVSRVIRDKLKENIKNIWVDSVDIYNSLKTKLKGSIKNSCNLKIYKNDAVSLFSYKNIERQLRTLLNKTVKFADGCYLIIEVTEAMNVIDVNSGNVLDKFDTQENLSLAVNLLAINEIVRQIKLRDMGGIISIDFIDMKLQKNKIAIYEKMKEMLYDDKSNVTVLPLSKFNVMQITRHRVRPVVQLDAYEKCPTCKGNGTIDYSVNIEVLIESEICEFLRETKCYFIDIYLNPILYSHFSIGPLSKRSRWAWKFFKSITLHPDYECNLNVVKIFNRQKFLKTIEI